MRPLVSRIDRRLALGIGVLTVSAALFVGAMASIFMAMSGDGADLPNEGSIEQIIGDTPQPAAPEATPPLAPAPLPPPPTRIAIPRLYIDAPVITMTLDAERSPQVPDRPDQVAWYDFSYLPGQGNNAVLSGHVDWQTRSGAPIAGVFYRLRELEIGDLVTITQDGGTELKYRVTGNVATTYDDPNIVRAMGPTSKDAITLITCGGAWVIDRSEQFGGSYSHRVVVRAERVVDAVEATEIDQKSVLVQR
jgi:LPXTG-site transpeptidase (sortase) family protein